MKTIETVVYEFDELSDAAKEKARSWAREWVYEVEWWDSTYDDAKTVGLKLTGFDLDRNRHALGEFIGSAPETAELILEHHGAACETHKTATAYLAALEAVNERYEAQRYDASGNLLEEGCEAYDEAREELDASFLRDLLSDYARMLQDEADHMYSDEYIDDMITANDYTFTESGKRFG